MRKHRHLVAIGGPEIHTEIATPVHQTFSRVEKMNDRLLYCVTTDRRSFPVKIGKTSRRNIQGRFTSLQVALPWKLRILLVVECDDAFEREMHRLCRDEHLRAECFIATIGLLDVIESTADACPEWVEFIPPRFRGNIGKAVR